MKRILQKWLFRLNRKRVQAYVLLFLCGMIFVQLYHKNYDVPNLSETSVKINDSKTEQVEIFNSYAYIRNASTFQKLVEEFFVYSAFYDNRNGNMDANQIRIVAVATQQLPNLVCKFSDILESPVTYYEMAENHAATFKTFIISCKLPEQLLQKVPFSFRLCNGVHFVNVQVINKIFDPLDNIPPINFGLCIPPLFGLKYTPKYLVEFFELTRLTGVQRIFLYANLRDLSEEILKVLNHYENENLLTLYHFETPFNVNQIWYHGQLITVQDCLFRNSGFSRTLLFHDFDEYVIPQSGETLEEAFEAIWDQDSNLAGFQFHSYYFTPQKGDLLTVVSDRHAVYVETLFTKCVVRPERVFEQGIHHVSRVIQHHYTVKRLEPKIAVLHHYKAVERDGMVRNSTVRDVYGAELKNNVDRVAEILKL